VKVSYCGDINYHWAVNTASLAFNGMQPCAMPAGSHSKAVYMQLANCRTMGAAGFEIEGATFAAWMPCTTRYGAYQGTVYTWKGPATECQAIAHLDARMIEIK